VAEQPVEEIVVLGLEDKWTSEQLAEYWGISRKRVSTAAKRGHIPGATQVLGRWYFDKVKALTWIPKEFKTLMKPGKAKEAEVTKKGHTWGPLQRAGRPTRIKEEAYLKLMISAVEANDWLAITMKAVEQAKAGDHKARTWLSNYLIGVPVQRIAAQIKMTHYEFEIGERAAAIMALLNAVRDREESVIDATARLVEEANSD